MIKFIIPKFCKPERNGWQKPVKELLCLYQKSPSQNKMIKKIIL